MKSVGSLLVFYSIFTVCQAQGLDIDWSNSLGGFGTDEGKAVCNTFDSGLLIVGYHSSTDGDVTEWFGQRDIWIVKLSEVGNIVWQKSIGGSLLEEALCVIPTSDSCFVICGYSRSSDGDIDTNAGFDDCLVMKIDNYGAIIWQASIGGSKSERAISIIETFDGCFIFTGYSYSNDEYFLDHTGSTDFSDLIIGKIDGFGNTIWIKSFGGIRSEEGYDIVETQDSNYIAIGTKDMFDNDFNYLAVKIDYDGFQLWSETYGGLGNDIAKSIFQFDENAFWISGYSNSIDGDIVEGHGSDDAWLIVIDDNGDLLASKCFGGSRGDRWHNAKRINENTFCFAGSTDSDDGDVIGYDGPALFPNYWIIGIDSSLVIKWQGCFGGSGTDACYGLELTDGDNFILTGFTFSNDGDVVDYHDDGGPTFPYDAWTLQVSNSCDPLKYYEDFDNDGFGNGLNYIYSCNDTVGYVLDFADCNDLDSLVSPIAAEICNEFDDNCNGEIDEGLIYTLYYSDEDGDGFGNADLDSLACLELLGFVMDSTDCNDLNSNIFPGALEILNGLDDDCDGQNDEGLSIETINEYNIGLYPNPTEGLLNIVFETPISSMISIYSFEGKLILNRIASPSTQIQIDFRNYPSGIYILTVQTQGQLQTFQVVRN